MSKFCFSMEPRRPCDFSPFPWKSLNLSPSLFAYRSPGTAQALPCDVQLTLGLKLLMRYRPWVTVAPRNPVPSTGRSMARRPSNGAVAPELCRPQPSSWPEQGVGANRSPQARLSWLQQHWADGWSGVPKRSPGIPNGKPCPGSLEVTKSLAGNKRNPSHAGWERWAGKSGEG